jgi:hypothetical protein
MKNIKLVCRTALALTVVSFSQIAFADGFTVRTGYDYSTGKYGTNTSTDITSIPFSINYEKEDWSVKATLPYLRITGANNVLPGVGAVGPVANAARTVSGLGDITLAATRALFMDAKAQMGFDVTGKIKFGTADFDKGLGTGENDYWVLADLYKRIGSITYFGGVGYGVLGDSPQLQLKNVISTNIGASYRLNDAASIGASFDTRTRSTNTGFAQRDMTLFYMHKLAAAYKLQAYAIKGFSDGSPDWGGGLNVGYSF